MPLTKQYKIAAIQKAILRWYKKQGRVLPWRGEQDPYKILVSEIMLQQTQVSRVLEKYPEFLKRYPNVKMLAKAPRSEVVRAWRGMGYNNRAVRLHQAAIEIVRRFGTRVPQEPAELIQLPGIGPYTANAIACFAFNKRLIVLDTNINRIISRFFKKEARKFSIEQIAERWLPRRAFDWNQALMDLGAMICLARNPRCLDCPVSGLCQSAFKVRSTVVKTPSNEPKHHGIPHRLWRGRIVELLRSSRASKMLLVDEILESLKLSISGLENDWLLARLHDLQKDGIVELKKKRGQVVVRLGR
jgi:A/G-specific adenine glycosylase